MRCGQQCAVSLLRGWDDVLGWIASQIDKVNFWPISYSHARTHIQQLSHPHNAPSSFCPPPS